MKRCWSILALLLLLCFGGCERTPEAPAVEQQPYTASVNLSTNRITIGDVITAQIDVYHPPEVQVHLPELDRDKEIVVRDRRYGEPSLLSTSPTDSNVAVTRIEYDLTSFRVGQFQVNTNQIHFTGSNNLREAIPFPETLLDVLTTLDSTNAPLQASMDVKDLPRRLPPWLTGLVAVLILALLGALAAAYFTRLRKQEESATPPPIIPPHIEALLALDQLEQAGFIDAQEVEPFYVALSDIVRRYLEDRFHLRAPEQTTEEFIREAAQSSRLHLAHQQLTQEFLQQSDLVKFAMHQPTIEDMKSGLQKARTLVHETTQPEEKA